MDYHVLVLEGRGQVDLPSLSSHPGFDLLDGSGHQTHALRPGLRDDDVILDPDSAKAAELVDPLFDQKLGQLGILEGLIQKVVDEVAARLN